MIMEIRDGEDRERERLRTPNKKWKSQAASQLARDPKKGDATRVYSRIQFDLACSTMQFTEGSKNARERKRRERNPAKQKMILDRMWASAVPAKPAQFSFVKKYLSLGCTPFVCEVGRLPGVDGLAYFFVFKGRFG